MPSLPIPSEARQWRRSDGSLAGVVFADSWSTPEPDPGAEGAARRFLLRHASHLGLADAELPVNPPPDDSPDLHLKLELYRSSGPIVVIGLVRRKDGLNIEGQGVTVHVRKRDQSVLAVISALHPVVLPIGPVPPFRSGSGGASVYFPAGQLRALLGLKGAANPWDGAGLRVTHAEARWARVRLPPSGHHHSQALPWTGTPVADPGHVVRVIDIDFKVPLRGRRAEPFRARIDLAGTVVYDVAPRGAGDVIGNWREDLLVGVPYGGGYGYACLVKGQGLTIGSPKLLAGPVIKGNASVSMVGSAVAGGGSLGGTAENDVVVGAWATAQSANVAGAWFF